MIKGPLIVPKNNLEVSRVMRENKYFLELLAIGPKRPSTTVLEYQGQRQRGVLGKQVGQPSLANIRKNGGLVTQPRKGLAQGRKMN